MIDSFRAFAEQFTAVDNGYLYYPSRKSGGKLITVDEFRALADAWRRRTNPWKIVGVGVVLIIIWTLVSDELVLPKWAESVFIASLVAVACGWTIWAAYAPRRLVKNRPEVAPARPPSEARRKARAALDWRLVLLVLLLSGAIFTARVLSPESTLRWWAWTVGSGLLFLGYVWIAVLKIRDNQQ